MNRNARSAPARKTRLIVEPGLCGIDEAGRGPWAGPVVVGAVVLPEGFDATGLDDSKKLTPLKRELLAQRIRTRATWSIAVRSPEDVDRMNVLRATLDAMREAGHTTGAERFLIDGDKLPDLQGATCEPKADGAHACVAAASILAKVERDRIMVEMDRAYPGYGFAQHKGYGTAEHAEALSRLGPCPIHRKSFAPIAELL